MARIATELGLVGTDRAGPAMAAVNTLLCAAPVPVRERLLVEFGSLLQSPAAHPAGAPAAAQPVVQPAGQPAAAGG